MRDFVDNLIDRHFNPEPRIKPRLRSMFEPDVSRSGMEFADHRENGTDDEERSFVRPSIGVEEAAVSTAETLTPAPSTHAAQRRSVPLKTGQAAQQQAHDERNGPTRAGPASPRPFVKQDGMMGLHPRTPQEPREERGADGASPPPRQIKEPQISLELRSKYQVERAKHRQAESNVTHDVLPPFDTSLSAIGSVLSPTVKPERPLDGLRSAREAEQAEHPSSGVETTSQIRPRSETRRGDQPTESLVVPAIPSLIIPARPISRPEPAINVTIGRIEVRATVSPQKHATKPESRSAVMGLEEYLRRRSDGRER